MKYECQDCRKRFKANTDGERDDLTCPKCGGSLRARQEVVPKEPTSNEADAAGLVPSPASDVETDVPDKKRCPFCKENIHRDAVKCPHCRSDQPKPATPRRPPPQSGDLGCILQIAVGIGAIGLLIIILVSEWQESFGRKPRRKGRGDDSSSSPQRSVWERMADVHPDTTASELQEVYGYTRSAKFSRRASREETVAAYVTLKQQGYSRDGAKEALKSMLDSDDTSRIFRNQ